MFANIRNLIEHTPRSTTLREGTGTFTVWAHNLFLAYDRPNSDCKWGSPNLHITPSQFSTQFANYCNFVLLLYRPVNRLYILTAAEGR